MPKAKTEEAEIERRRKLSEALKGHPPYYHGGFRGKHTEESKLKNRLAHLGKPAHNKGQSPSKEVKAKIASGVSKAWEDGRLTKPPPKEKPPSFHERLSAGVKRAWDSGKRNREMSDESKAKLSITTARAWKEGRLKGYPHREETKQLLSLRTRQAFLDGKLPPRPPTELEKQLERLLERHFPSEWIYTGDGKVTVEGYRPDFMHSTRKDLLIEAFGSRWHTEQEAEERIARLSKYGYRVLIIWEPPKRKLDEKSVVSLVSRFCEGRFWSGSDRHPEQGQESGGPGA